MYHSLNVQQLIINKRFAQQNLFEPIYLKQTIKGNNFHRYFCPPNSEDLILYITSNFNEEEGTNIYKYLLESKDKLIQKSSEKNKNKWPWYQLFRGRKEKIFTCPKIIIRQTADRIIAAIDESVGYYCIDSIICAPFKKEFLQEDMYFVLGLLNSKVINFFYRQISQEKGRVLPQVKIERLKRLPLKEGTDLQKAVIIEKVNQIIKNNNSKEVREKLIIDIDNEIYKIYELDEETISLIESSF